MVQPYSKIPGREEWTLQKVQPEQAGQLRMLSHQQRQGLTTIGMHELTELVQGAQVVMPGKSFGHIAKGRSVLMETVAQLQVFPAVRGEILVEQADFVEQETWH